MTLDEFNAFCASLPKGEHCVQWGGAHVWKVGGKVFAIAGWSTGGERPGVTFKCSPFSFELLGETAGCRPAPYLASRGMKWIQRISREGLGDEELKAYLAESHRLVALGLPKRVRRELGLEPDLAGRAGGSPPA